MNEIIHGDCIEKMRPMPSESIDLVVTDPPFITDYKPRDGRKIANDDNHHWLRPAFTEIHRVLKPNSLCFSFYGWPQAEKFLWTWKRIGFAPVSHFVFVKEYVSKEGYSLSQHEVAYLLAKGRPPIPANPLSDVIPFRYTGNELHPNQKPVEAIQPIIETYSKVGDVILDPFAGSGTTGIAAQNCDRRFILIEKLWRYYELAINRL